MKSITLMRFITFKLNLPTTLEMKQSDKCNTEKVHLPLNVVEWRYEVAEKGNTQRLNHFIDSVDYSYSCKCRNKERFNT